MEADIWSKPNVTEYDLLGKTFSSVLSPHKGYWQIYIVLNLLRWIMDVFNNLLEEMVEKVRMCLRGVAFSDVQ